MRKGWTYEKWMLSLVMVFCCVVMYMMWKIHSLEQQVKTRELIDSVIEAQIKQYSNPLPTPKQ